MSPLIVALSYGVKLLAVAFALAALNIAWNWDKDKENLK